jgi:HD-GYP domain-containing protein (c-di-GMP phosphodiesterase class II)
LASLAYVTGPGDDGQIAAAACFAALGFAAQVLSYSVRSAIGGSTALLPFLTVAILAPNWIGSLAVATAALASSTFLRADPLKGSFNIAQATLASSLAILAYRGLGGAALDMGLRGDALIASPRTFPAYLGLVLVFAAVNTLAVGGAVAINERRSLASVVRASTLKTLIYDVLSVPFVYLFAKVYLAWGPLGVAGLSIPLLGVRQLYKVNWQLEQAHQELLEMMVANLEARDPYTSGHSRRVARNARIIARIIGLNSRQLERVAVAALLHDVGKIHEVFAPLLRKPDRLTPEEWAIMQTHPVKSAELVAKVSQLKDVVGPVRHHHENWDGSGYPDGLAGDEIPIAARIIMFADTIDAMTTDRPYRRAMNPQQVRDELARQRGKQFDPEMCEKLLKSPQFSLLFADLTRGSTPGVLPVFGRTRKTAAYRS